MRAFARSLGQWNVRGGATWGLVDQGLSSTTNLLLGVLLAREVTPSEFGAYALAFAAYTWVTSAVASVAIEPLVVRYAGADEREKRRGTAMALGVAVTVGLVAGGISLLVAVVFEDLRGAFVPLGFALPGIVLQDAQRLALFATGRGRTALANDIVRLTVLLALSGGLILLNEISTPTILIIWGIGSSAAASWTFFRTRVVPDPGAIALWWKLHSYLITRFAAEFLTLNSAAQVTTVGVALAAGVAATGVLRGVDILLGPITVLSFVVTITGVPHALRLLRSSKEDFSTFVSTVPLLLMSATALWGAVLLLLPASIGVSILGSLWTGARLVIVPLLLLRLFAALSTAGMIRLRATGNARRSLRAQIFASLLTISGGIGGAATGGIVGAAWGLALAASLGTVVWYVEARRALLEWRPVVVKETGFDAISHY